MPWIVVIAGMFISDGFACCIVASNLLLFFFLVLYFAFTVTLIITFYNDLAFTFWFAFSRYLSASSTFPALKRTHASESVM